MTRPDPDDGLPGTRFAMSVIHPGSETLRVRYRKGVLVTPAGFPDWPLCARVLVELPPPDGELTRDEVRVVDVLAANLAMSGVGGTADGDPLWPPGERDPVAVTPAGWCWAHVGGTRQLALVPIELHGSYRHTGGMATLPVASRGLRTDTEPVPVRWARGDQVPDELLGVLERLLGWPLPDRYRRFVARTNGAGPEEPAVLPGFGFVADQPFFGIARQDRHQDLSYVGPWVADRLTRDFLPISYVQGGLLAVKVAGADVDSIWYWDDDDPRDRERYDADHICAHLLHRCADSVDDLWAALARPAAALFEVARHWVGGGQVRQVRDNLVGAGLPATLRAPWQAAPRPGSDPLTALFEARLA